jgi:DNA repair protein RAD5
LRHFLLIPLEWQFKISEAFLVVFSRQRHPHPIMSRQSDRTPSPSSSSKPQKALFLVDTSDEDETSRTGHKRKRGTQPSSSRVKSEPNIPHDADVVMLSSPDAKLAKAASRQKKPRAAPTFERGLLGTCVCSAWSLTKGKGYCTPGSSVVIERPKTKEEKEAERLAKSAEKGKGKSSGTTVIKNGKVIRQSTLSLGSKPKPTAATTKLTATSANNPQDTIIRFSNTRGFEIGRLPTALARHLAPLLASNLIHLSGTIIDCPVPLTIGCDITLEVSVYLRREAFITQEAREDLESEKATWGKEGETTIQRELRMRKDSLAKLFERVGLKPIRSSALTRSQAAAAKSIGGKVTLKGKAPPSKSGSPEVIEFEDSSDEERKPVMGKLNGKGKINGAEKTNGAAKPSMDKGKGKQVDIKPKVKRETGANADGLDDDADSGAEEEVLDEKQLHDLESIFNRYVEFPPSKV